MSVEIPDPLEGRRPAGFDLLIFRDQEPPLLNVVPLDRPIETVVTHQILLNIRVDLISELVNFHNCERSEAIQSQAGSLDCFVTFGSSQ